MCWNITGSPPPAASKKLVAKYLSVSTIVTAPASTGITAINKKAVINHVHTNKGNFIHVMPGARKFTMVTITLIAPIIELIPIICTANTNNAVLSLLYVVDSGA